MSPPTSPTRPRRARSRSRQRFKPDDTKLADCAADSACFEQAFGNLAYYGGPEGGARASSPRMIETDPTVRVCHRIAHALGAGALAHYHGEVGAAFADGSAVCWSGYYHGILERAFAGVSEEACRPSPAACARARRCGGTTSSPTSACTASVTV